MKPEEPIDWFTVEQLHLAAMDGDAEKCERLITEGYDPNGFDQLGKTPFHYAAEGEHFEVVKLLLAHSANVNAHHEATIGNTPLAEVAGNCSLKMAKMLLEAGADPRIRGWMQLNALDNAKDRKRGGGPRVYELLCKFAGHNL